MFLADNTVSSILEKRHFSALNFMITFELPELLEFRAFEKFIFRSRQTATSNTDARFL